MVGEDCTVMFKLYNQGSAEIFSERLCDIMDRKHISVPELAKKSGISKWTIYGYRTVYEKLPMGASLWLLADALNVSIDYLVGRTDK